MIALNTWKARREILTQKLTTEGKKVRVMQDADSSRDLLGLWRKTCKESTVWDPCKLRTISLQDGTCRSYIRPSSSPGTPPCRLEFGSQTILGVRSCVLALISYLRINNTTFFCSRAFYNKNLRPFSDTSEFLLSKEVATSSARLGYFLIDLHRQNTLCKFNWVLLCDTSGEFGSMRRQIALCGQKLSDIDDAVWHCPANWGPLRS